MESSLVWTALLMGLAGGPHCAAMCGAACTGVARLSSLPIAGAGLQPVSMPGTRSLAGATWALQAGRLLGYSAVGALAATAMQSLAWLTSQTVVLKPVWTLFHLALLGWGLLLLTTARQPAWVETAGRALWARVQPLARAPGGLLATGALWALVPCGLLYSALLVAALSGGPFQGALAMALFAAGSGIGMVLGPWLMLRIHDRFNHWRQDWGTRLAGFVLAVVAGWAVWMNMMGGVGEFCF